MRIELSEKNLLENKEMVFKNRIKNIQAWNRHVYGIQKKSTQDFLSGYILTKIFQNYV